MNWLKQIVSQHAKRKWPWHSSRKVWALIPKEAMAIGGWSEILEDRCVPDDEAQFHKASEAAAGKK